MALSKWLYPPVSELNLKILERGGRKVNEPFTIIRPRFDRLLGPGTVEIRYLVYRECYTLGGLFLPLPRPGPLSRLAGILYRLVPTLLAPFFLLASGGNFFRFWHPNLARQGVILVQFLLSLAAPRNREGREGLALGALLAPALYGLLRGWEIAAAPALLATTASWLLLSLLTMLPGDEPALPGMEHGI